MLSGKIFKKTGHLGEEKEPSKKKPKQPKSPVH